MELYCFGESGHSYKAALALQLAGCVWSPVFVDFFKGETQSLSNFLEFDILPPVIKSDRTYSMKYDIDSETWRYAYKKYKWLYDEFENTFGFIPDAWIDAGFYK